jgi:chemotaxis response regulator CheB
MKKSSFFVVGLGFFIGCISPLFDIIGQIDFPSNAAFLIIQHLSPSFRSELCERLQTLTQIKGTVAGDVLVIIPNQIYALTEEQMMTIEKGSLVVRKRRHDETVNKAVDILLESMAGDWVAGQLVQSFRVWMAMIL